MNNVAKYHQRKIELQLGPLTAYLWDDISGEWGPAYPNVNVRDDHKLVHAAINDFIDQDGPEDEDEIIFHLACDHFYANIGSWGGRDHLWVEIWGDFADRVRAQLPDDWSPSSALVALTDLASRYRLARK